MSGFVERKSDSCLSQDDALNLIGQQIESLRSDANTLQLIFTDGTSLFLRAVPVAEDLPDLDADLLPDADDPR